MRCGTRPASRCRWSQIRASIKPEERKRLMAQAQRLAAEQAVAAYLYQPTWITAAKARLKGLWKDMPLFVNDLPALHGQ